MDECRQLALGVIQALQHAVGTTPRPGWVRGDAPSNESLLGEIRELRLENDNLRKRNHAASNSKRSLTKDELLHQIAVEYTIGEGKKKHPVTLNLLEIVSETQLTEELSDDVISQSIRGAIAVKTSKPYEHLVVSTNEVDKVALLLASHQIIAPRKVFWRIALRAWKNLGSGAWTGKARSSERGGWKRRMRHLPRNF